MNVWQDTSTGNSDSSQKLVQFFVILDSQSNVSGHNTALLVVTSSVSSKLKNFGAKVFQDGSQVDGGSSSHTSGILSLSQISSDTTDRELQTGLGRCSSGLLFSTASFSFSCYSKRIIVVRISEKRDVLSFKRKEENVPDMIVVCVC